FPHGELDMASAIQKLQELRFDRPHLVQKPDQFRMALLLTQQLKYVKQSGDFSFNTTRWEQQIDDAAYRYQPKIVEHLTQELPTLRTKERMQAIEATYNEQKKNAERRAGSSKILVELIVEKVKGIDQGYVDKQTVGRWFAMKNKMKNSAVVLFNKKKMGIKMLGREITRIINNEPDKSKRLSGILIV